MDGVDRVDDRTFRVSFTSEGVSKLRLLLKDKLKEFLDDYTDDTLVEYVIVLIKNGRQKDEARNELNVFLGDDTNSFVSWLWDHLGSNIDLYSQPRVSQSVLVSKTKPTSGEQAEKPRPNQIESDPGREKSKRESRSRHNSDWKEIRGDTNELPSLTRSQIGSSRKDVESHDRAIHHKRSLSPQPLGHKKRSRTDEGQHKKKEVGSQATVGAPRRLLQFAVRDAVATARPSSSATEHLVKHIRSVVSAPTHDSSLEEHPRRLQSVARVPNVMATAVKAAAEAAQDVTRDRSSRNVFDRLGCATFVSSIADQQLEESTIRDEEFRDVERFQEEHSTYFQQCDYNVQKDRNFTALESGMGVASTCISNSDVYDDVDVRKSGAMNVSQTATSDRNQGNDLLLVQYNVAGNSRGTKSKSWNARDQPASIRNTSAKIVNMSMNVNTWTPPERKNLIETPDMDSRKSVLENKAGTNISGMQPMKNNNKVTIGNGNARPPIDVQKETQMSLPPNVGLHSTTRPIEDVDSRTIFVNNVHFAATKDSLSRHFNKFGEVLKVVILTDVSTGQPKGSAYVEFMRKEAVEHALSLDGTSFMSRILKVMKKSSAPPDTATALMWPRVARGSPFTASRFGRIPFTRGISSIYRARIPLKSGARSLQWTRDGPSTPTESVASIPNNTVPLSGIRSLTYVRPTLDANGNTGAS